MVLSVAAGTVDVNTLAVVLVKHLVEEQRLLHELVPSVRATPTRAYTQNQLAGPGYLASVVPAERRSSQPSTTRAAIPASAVFPYVRGSYAFLLPTLPSTLSTPS
jgi:hypothetical protein